MGDNKKKKCIIAGGVSGLLVIMVVSVAVITSKHSNKKNEPNVQTTTKAVQAVCAPTDFKETCQNSLMKASPNSTQPIDLIKLGFDITIASIQDGIKKASAELKAKADPESKGALELCETLMDDAIGDLRKCFDNFNGFSLIQLDLFVENLRVWASGSIAFQRTCIDTFEEVMSSFAKDMQRIFETSRMLTSNSLAMVTGISELISAPGIKTGEHEHEHEHSHKRRLMATEDGIPTWVGPEARHLMQAPAPVKANAVVAQDGSGQYKTIGAAVAAVPKGNTQPFVIQVKAGVYKEKVSVPRGASFITLVGDGPTKTKITGNLNFGIGKVKTYQTATVAIDGDHFTAKNIGIENTAGPEGHQAVALRVSADYAVFHNCQIDGYQDTLYVHSHRQFFRDCIISGTVDFIFGDAQCIFQNCQIVIRKPMKGQNCMVTAQGRSDAREPTGIIIQNSHILGEPAYLPVKTIHKGYLGRPWREFARTIVMKTKIDDVIDPAGWTPWTGDFALKTLFYAEHENTGPGANLAQRVKWPGIRKLSPADVASFSAGKFLAGDTWIPQTKVPYTP